MSSELKHRRGTAAAHASFIGAQGEITVKTDTNEIVVHDGVTPGGKTGGGYMPAGTGAVATTVQSKLRETVSVKDFGAVGDGVTDDTAAIQAAIDSVGVGIGVEIFVPAGTYKLTAPVRLKRNTIIRGAGRSTTTITQTGDTAGFVMNETTDGQLVYGIILQDFSLTKQTQTSTADANGIWLTGTLNNVWDACIENVNVSNFYDGIRIDRPVLTRITSGNIANNYRNGIFIGSGGTSLVVKNTFSRLNGSHGYYVEGGLYYCHFDTTAADNNAGCGYYIRDASGAYPASFVFSGCGCELNGADGFKFQRVDSFVLNGCFSFRNTGNGYNIISASRDIQFIGSKAVNNTGYGIATDSTNRNIVAHGAPFTYPGLANNVAGSFNTNTDLSVLDNAPGKSSQTYFAYIPFTYENFANTFTTGDYATPVLLPANAVVVDCYIQLTTAFSGGAVASATMQVGGPNSPGSSPYNQYLAAQNVFTGASGVITSASGVKVVSQSANGRVIARLICTGGNTNTLTAGAGVILVEYKVLP